MQPSSLYTVYNPRRSSVATVPQQKFSGKRSFSLTAYDKETNNTLNDAASPLKNVYQHSSVQRNPGVSNNARQVELQTTASRKTSWAPNSAGQTSHSKRLISSKAKVMDYQKSNQDTPEKLLLGGTPSCAFSTHLYNCGHENDLGSVGKDNPNFNNFVEAEMSKARSRKYSKEFSKYTQLSNSKARSIDSESSNSHYAPSCLRKSSANSHMSQNQETSAVNPNYLPHNQVSSMLKSKIPIYIKNCGDFIAYNRNATSTNQKSPWKTAARNGLERINAADSNFTSDILLEVYQTRDINTVRMVTQHEGDKFKVNKGQSIINFDHRQGHKDMKTELYRTYDWKNSVNNTDNVSAEEFRHRLLQAHQIVDELLKERGLIAEDELEYYRQWCENMANDDQKLNPEDDLKAVSSETEDVRINERRRSSASDSGLSLSNDSENDSGNNNRIMRLQNENDEGISGDGEDKSSENICLEVQKIKKHKTVRLKVTIKKQDDSIKNVAEAITVKLGKSNNQLRRISRMDNKADDETNSFVLEELKSSGFNLSGEKHENIEIISAFDFIAKKSKCGSVIYNSVLKEHIAVSKLDIHENSKKAKLPLQRSSNTRRKEFEHFFLPRLSFYCRKFSGINHGPNSMETRNKENESELANDSKLDLSEISEEKNQFPEEPKIEKTITFEKCINKKQNNMLQTSIEISDNNKKFRLFKNLKAKNMEKVPRKKTSFLKDLRNRGSIANNPKSTSEMVIKTISTDGSNDEGIDPASNRLVSSKVQERNKVVSTMNEKLSSKFLSSPNIDISSKKHIQVAQNLKLNNPSMENTKLVVSVIKSYKKQPKSIICIKLHEQVQSYAFIKPKFYQKTLKTTSGLAKVKEETREQEKLNLLSARENLKRIKFNKTICKGNVKQLVPNSKERLDKEGESVTFSSPSELTDLNERTERILELKNFTQKSSQEALEQKQSLKERENIEQNLIAEFRRSKIIPKPRAEIPVAVRSEISETKFQQLTVNPNPFEARFIRRRTPEPLEKLQSPSTSSVVRGCSLKHVSRSHRAQSQPVTNILVVQGSQNAISQQPNSATVNQFGVTLKRVDWRIASTTQKKPIFESKSPKPFVPKWRKLQRSEEEEEEEVDEEVAAEAVSNVKEEDVDKLTVNRAPSRRPSQVALEKDEKDMTEAEKAMLEAKKRHEEEDAAKLQEYEELRRIEREREEEELKQLKEKKERRKLEREEEERQFQERLRQEEERRKQEEDERKAKIEAEKRKKEEEKRKRQQMLSSQFAPTQPGQTGRNFIIPQKSDKADKFGNIVQAKQEMGMTKEQQEEAKRNFLASVKRTIEIDYASISPADLREKIRTLHQRICKLEADRYDLEKRHERQEYDLRELNERQRQVARNKALKKGLDPADTNSRHPPKVSIVSKYDRQIDRRNFSERRAMFENKNAYPCFPNVPPPPTIYEKVIRSFDEEKENEPDEEQEEDAVEQVEEIAEEEEEEE